MSEPATPFTSSNPIVQRLLSGTAPLPIRLAAARGALPMTPEEQFHVLASISVDPDPALQEALGTAVAGLPDDSLAGLLRERALTPELLGFYAAHVLDRPQSVAAVITHPSTSDATLGTLAARGGAEVLELLVTNQVRLIRAPELMDAVLGNPRLSPDQRRRIEEVREEFFHKKEREEKRRRDEEERLARLREKKDWTASELERLADDLAKEATADLQTGALAADYDDPDAESEDASKSAYQRILNMGVPEKVLLAVRGSRTERNLLIKDSNRLVCTSVIKSPKINEKDVELFAGMRNISDEILRIIGHRREWLKSYAVVHTLIKNPRTPLAVSINLLPRLQTRDLKHLEGDRNVSESLRRQAKQLLDRANKKSGSH